MIKSDFVGVQKKRSNQKKNDTFKLANSHFLTLFSYYTIQLVEPYISLL